MGGGASNSFCVVCYGLESLEMLCFVAVLLECHVLLSDECRVGKKRKTDEKELDVKIMKTDGKEKVTY